MSRYALQLATLCVVLLPLPIPFVCEDTGQAFAGSPRAESTTASPESRPNILIVYTDDQAAWAVGNAVKQGQFDDVPAAVTPHMDRLAREGVVFENFFCTTPVCSPARATWMTGRYASEFGIHDFIPMPGHKLFDPQQQVFLDPDQSQTFAELLRQQGYRTGLVGKWHLGDWTLPGHERFHPTNHGFDYFMGLTGGGTSPKDPELEENGEVRKLKGLTTDLLTERALKFIDRNQDRRFLLCVHTRAPHGAWLPVAPEDWQPYESLDPTIPNPSYPDLNVGKMKRQMREYLASTSGVDRNLGKLLDRLDQLRLTDKTVVIFSSDHGYTMGHNGIWHKGNGIWATKKPPRGTHQGTRVISSKYRPNLYDHSLRTPAIVRWPGVAKADHVVRDTATSLDLWPTIAEIAGVEMGRVTGNRGEQDNRQPVAASELPGRSLVPLLRGERPVGWRQEFFAEYKMINYAEADLVACRTPHYKLIRDRQNEGRDEFYDLRNDPGETNNLIADSSPPILEAIRRLDEKLTGWMASMK
ncbi:sulfatase family protein [Roseiconus lacunae]|uniref:Sulfatase-like hydrolase/transferase n=1 Tax=Roseiconus lacunae TaxID=2605694 RepID=A0ABT7PDD0_9BACT|nr:sulfatase-like hydrolase/transferase [Roseiconus lacunae]MDM4014497.1 sulfatase-like hydrolase/transferase [Roseiconus lacunae]